MDLNEPLIEGTARDKLLVRIEKDRLEQARKDEEEKRKRQIELEARQQKHEIESIKLGTIYSICSVYRLLLLEMGMAPGLLSLEEFEVAEAEFKKLAQQKASSWILRIRHRKQWRWWKYYLEYGCFPEEDQSEDRPLSFNNGAVTGWIYCEHMRYIQFRYCSEDTVKHLTLAGGDHKNDGVYIPTNFLELYKQLEAKRIKTIKNPDRE